MLDVHESFFNITGFYSKLEELISAVNSENWYLAYMKCVELENTVNMMLAIYGKINGVEEQFKKLRYAIHYTPVWSRKLAVKEKLEELLNQLSRFGIGFHSYSHKTHSDNVDAIVEGIYNSVRWLDKVLMYLNLAFSMSRYSKGAESTNQLLMMAKMYADKILSDLMAFESNNKELNGIAHKMKEKMDEFIVSLNNVSDDKTMAILTESMKDLMTLARSMYEIVQKPDYAAAIKESVERAIGEEIPIFEIVKPHTEIQKPTQVKPGSFDWVDDDWKIVLRHPYTFVILGSRGEGKSQLGHTLLEYYASTYDLDAYFFSPFGKEVVYRRVPNLPDWIKVVDKLGELGTDCVVLFDEFHNVAHARRGMAHDAITIDKLIELSRQNDQTHIFVTQRSTKLDRNIIMSDATLLIKKPSMMQVSFERQELKEIILEALDEFKKLERTLEYPEQRKSYVYVVCEEFAQERKFGKMKRHGMASYWSEDLSKVFRGA